MKRILLTVGALAWLVALALPAVAEWTKVGSVSSAAARVEERLDYTDAALSLTPRSYAPVPGFVLFFDDADTSFATFTTICDSIETARSWTTDKIRGVVGIMASQASAGAATHLTWAQISALPQGQFEVALHGNSSERFGSLDVGMSRVRADSLLASWQTQMQDSAGFRAAGMLLPNHRTTLAFQDTFMKNRLEWVFGLRVPISQDSTSGGGYPRDNEQSPMDINYDAWPGAMINQAGADYACYLRPGGVSNRWNLARKSSWSRSGDSVQEVKDNLNLAIQTNTIAALTFHTIEDGGGDLSIERDSLIAILDYAADLIDADMIQSLTASQAVSRATGYVVGRLNPHHNFTRISDLDASSALVANSWVPIGWPMYQGTDGVASFYMDNGDTVGGGTAQQWKVIDLAVTDTVLAVFSAEYSADSVSYGATSDTSRVLVAAAISTDNYRTAGLPIIIRTTGVRADHIEVSVQCMSFGGASVNHFPGMHLYQFGEDKYDFINTGAASYDFVFETSPSAAWDSTRWEPQRTRTYPQFMVAGQDSNWAPPFSKGWTNATSREFHWFSRPFCRPLIYEYQTTYDLKAPFGNYGDIFAAGSGADEVFANMDAATSDRIDGGVDHGRAHWITYHYRVEIMPLKTDWVAGSLYFRHSTTSPAADIEWIISDVAAWAPY